MPVLIKKREAEAAGTRGSRPQLARAAVLTRAAVPMAKTAGIAARDGARSTATWAVPRINGARAWIAPRIERSGQAIQDTIAPRICVMLTATARRVDVPAPRVEAPAPRRRWPALMTGAAMLAAAGAGAAVVLRRRKNESTGEAPGEASGAGPSPQLVHDGQPRDEADGTGMGADVSRQSR